MLVKRVEARECHNYINNSWVHFNNKISRAQGTRDSIPGSLGLLVVRICIIANLYNLFK